MKKICKIAMMLVMMGASVTDQVMTGWRTDKVLMLARTLKPGNINMTLPAKNPCDCRSMCVAVPDCKVASAEDGQCHLSYLPHYTDNMFKASTNATSFFWTKYEVWGSRLYRLYTEGSGRNWKNAQNNCILEGGQLAVANTEEKKNEVIQILTEYGVNSTWMGLYRPKDGSLAWQYGNSESNTDQPFALTHSTVFIVSSASAQYEESVPASDSNCFSCSVSMGILVTSGSLSCYQQLPFLCQRHF